MSEVSLKCVRYELVVTVKHPDISYFGAIECDLDSEIYGLIEA
jgi:hypothetical protein